MQKVSILHTVNRLLCDEQSLMQSGVCHFENIVIHRDRQNSIFYEYSILSVIIQIQNIFMYNLCKANNTNSYIRCLRSYGYI